MPIVRTTHLAVHRAKPIAPIMKKPIRQMSPRNPLPKNPKLKAQEPYAWKMCLLMASYAPSRLLALLLGCRSYKEKSQVESERVSSSDTWNYLYQGLMKQYADTYNQFWSFQTDSNFRFHADSGLVGKSGLLQIYTYGRQTESINAAWDSISVHSQTTADVQVEQKLKKEPSKTHSIWRFIIVIVVGTAAVWFFRYLIRHRR